MVVRGDVVLALSASGETEEILALLATIKRLRVPLIAMTGDESCVSHCAKNQGFGGAKSKPHLVAKNAKERAGHPFSTLAAAADVALDCSIAQEACSLGTGAYGFDYDHAGVGGCVGGDC